ncbi:AraC family transcriptional regulator [Paenibacillus selenitireducens]|uniref:AraC family transcriptional regulator n=1 Tax=Paenibacillus selenitireducens TaxID=1324314 RepID=A0A1T2XNM8_9BACL|nr:AraC family transcriptional regulator [Paenibacillus selenitireducens]OPA81395.1 AraC family transcriptional regulator [Paenibacillus selenitireducens]
MERWDVIHAVQRMQDYIDEHITEVITLAQLAKAAGYSPWHSARIFKELLHRTPFDYIRALRLSKAALVLRDEHSKVVDVALDFVFDSHEGFTRAFTKQFGLSPRKYSQEVPPIRLFIPYRVHDSYLTFPKGEKPMAEKQTLTKTVFVQVMERPQRKVMLKRGVIAEEYFTFCEEVGCEVWGVLTSVKEALYEPIGMWLPQHLIPAGTSKYVQGVELSMDFDRPIPDGYDLIELPPCKMMVFQGEPFQDEQFREAIGELWETMDHYQPELYGFEWADEEAPRFQLSPMGYRGYIEGRPVRQINPTN